MTRGHTDRLLGAEIVRFLFNSRRPVDLCPAIVGQSEIPERWRARRNRSGTGTVSRHLVKAVCAALLGSIGQAYPGRDGQKAYGQCHSSSGSGTYEVSVDNGTGTVTAAHLGYQVPMAYLVEALVQAEQAHDLWQAWIGLLEQLYSAGHAPPLSGLKGMDWASDEEILGRILQVSDELYYFIRFCGQAPDPDSSRIEGQEVRAGQSPGFTPDVAAGNRADLLFDASGLRRALDRTATEAVEQPTGAVTTEETAPDSAFIGPQLAWLMEDLADRHGGWAVLLTGPTGTGKTLCVREAIRLLQLPHEVIPGSEGLEDRDFVGALLLDNGSTRFMDGPLTRACRRASAANFAERYLLLWLKEITRMRPQQLNLLMSFMDHRSGQELDLMQVVPEVHSPTDRYHLLEVPDTAERIAVPVERLALVADCNIGAQYAVRSLDPALDRRFTSQVELDYLPPDAEARLLAESTGLPQPVCRKMVQVATETRRLCENAEVAAPLDTGSLLAWGAKVRRGWRDGLEDTSLLAVLTSAATTTWMARVAGRDHRGRVDVGTKQGLLDFVATTFGVA